MATLTDIIKVTNVVEGKLYDLFSNDSSLKFTCKNLLKENYQDYFDRYDDYESDFNMYGHTVLYYLEFSFQPEDRFYVDLKLDPRDFFNSKLNIHITYGFEDGLKEGQYHIIEDQEGYMNLLDVLVDFIEHVYFIATRDF